MKTDLVRKIKKAVFYWVSRKLTTLSRKLDRWKEVADDKSWYYQRKAHKYEDPRSVVFHPIAKHSTISKSVLERIPLFSDFLNKMVNEKR